MANDLNSQVQKRLDQIEQLQMKVDTVKVEAEEWKKKHGSPGLEEGEFPGTVGFD